jgi:hypothetical protein
MSCDGHAGGTLQEITGLISDFKASPPSRDLFSSTGKGFEEML